MPSATDAAPASSLQLIRTLGVVLFGLASTTIAIAVVYFAGEQKLNLMGWYVSYVIPAGAIGVGLLASSGFGLGARLLGRRADVWLVAMTVVVLGAAYFFAEYLEFRLKYTDGVVDDDGVALGFWRYFDYVTRAFYFHNKDSLGVFGYGLRVLELGGFLSGGVVAPLLLGARPYCEACKRYRALQLLAFVADPEDVAAILAHHGSGAMMSAELDRLAPASRRAEIQHLPERHVLRLFHCTSCASGWVQDEVLAGLPDQEEGLLVQKVPLDPVVVRALSRRA